MKQAGVPKLDLPFSTCRCLRLTSLLPVHVQSACVVARFFWPPTSEDSSALFILFLDCVAACFFFLPLAKAKKHAMISPRVFYLVA